ncbi:response regulator [Deinococcus radiopugnans]|uniref:DNA-binding response OmpR family regulator n=1 Tax=Deinococcus radiopugnans ATCC 19172 TaxID=585398 RepID=A0A5C4XUW9_9DEIO|nr:response regulator [Deinococcus radiopugnans]MBB6018658.1 DNA-binding response OmpR family regulator [Deinococcus radiopugnans ATCC 19172]TNM67027.1 response regulator [Deinococcus radiopugnans ATCC 19172]
MGRQPQWAARLSDADWQHLTALRLFHAVQPELALLEVALPRVDGFGILRQVRQAGENPVIMLAACMDDIDRLVDLQMGTDASVIHPFPTPV